MPRTLTLTDTSWIDAALNLRTIHSVTRPSGGQKGDEWEAMISSSNHDLITLVVGGPRSLLAVL